MKRKHIDAAREARLWIGQIIVPTMTLAVTVLGIPEVRQAVLQRQTALKNLSARNLRRPTNGLLFLF